MMKKFRVMILLCTLLLAGCGQQSVSADAEPQSIDLFAMDTTMTLTAYGDHAEDALAGAKSEIERLDALFSISSESGDIYALNRDHKADFQADSLALLNRALEVSASTDGIFDCTIEPVMEAWGFTTQNYRVPEENTLNELLSHVDYRQVQVDGSTVSIPDDVQVDLGGIAKGFTSDRMMQVFADSGVTSGIISLGGNVQALGCKPDGSKWRVAVQDPNDEGENFAVVEIADEAVITSGGYQRYFEENGKRYWHILDARTGMPADTGIRSVTVVSADDTLADGLSTALFVMGLDRAAQFWRESRDFEAVFLLDSGEIYVTQGLEDSFRSERSFEVLVR